MKILKGFIALAFLLTLGGCSNELANGSSIPSFSIPDSTDIISGDNNNITVSGAVFDNSLNKSIKPEAVYDDKGNEYQRYILKPSCLEHDYTISGKLDNAQIYVLDASESYSAVINLENTSISNSYDSPIFIESADKVEISAKADTKNYLYDNRYSTAKDDVNASDLGKGVIYSRCDLKLKGRGYLYALGSYYNGIHSTKDLEIKNLSLKVKAYNDAIRGNDSITIESGSLDITSVAGDGLKTTDNDLSSKGKQRGNIDILGGSVNIYSCFDGIDASFNANISGEAVTNIYTWMYAYEKNNSIDISLNSYNDEIKSKPMGGGRPGGPGG